MNTLTNMINNGGKLDMPVISATLSSTSNSHVAQRSTAVMRYFAKITLFSFLLSPFAQSFTYAQEFDKETAVQEVKAITKAFAGSLQSELQGAMKSGGPLNALNVCNVEAMPITAKSAENSNALISRVSLKNRNPANVPNDWQRAVLEDFDKRAADGEDPATMASATVVQTDDGKHQMRFMKATPAGGVCLACHGQQIDTELQSKLDELYPEDKATGYSLGEVRGAIVVIKDY